MHGAVIGRSSDVAEVELAGLNEPIGTSPHPVGS